jgi:4-amino-4-deoxy-L-arabinose transferase-like glycosyltransferase
VEAPLPSIASARRAAMVVALGTVALHVACSGKYGWFRDEMYFIACGRRLAWGYVDHPPLVAAIARVAIALSRGSVLAFRLPAILAHAATVLLVGRFAVRLGGGPFAAALSALCAAVAPIVLGEGHLFTMNIFEILLWMALLDLTLRLIDGADHRLWIAAGALAGIGILNKHSFAVLCATLLVGLLCTKERRVLRSRFVVAGAAIAAALVLPHAIWQVRHGFPMRELLAAQEWKNVRLSPLRFVLEIAREMHPVTAPIWLLGLWLSWRTPRLRPFAISAVGIVAVFALLHGKPYYASPACPVLFAAGGFQLERLIHGAAARGAALAAVLVLGLATAPLAIPLLPPETLVRWQALLHAEPPKTEHHRFGALSQHFADQFGWLELTHAVESAAAQLPRGERAAIFTQNYGEAGALELLGRGLPPVVSGHNSYFTWGPPEADVLLVVGGREDDARRACADLRTVARVAHAVWAMPYEQDLPIFSCRGLRIPIAELWVRLKHYE